VSNAIHFVDLKMSKMEGDESLLFYEKQGGEGNKKQVFIKQKKQGILFN